MSCYLSLQTIIPRLRSNINLRNHHFSRKAKYPLYSFDSRFTGYLLRYSSPGISKWVPHIILWKTCAKMIIPVGKWYQGSHRAAKKNIQAVIIKSFPKQNFHKQKTPELMQVMYSILYKRPISQGLWHPAFQLMIKKFEIVLGVLIRYWVICVYYWLAHSWLFRYYML